MTCCSAILVGLLVGIAFPPLIPVFILAGSMLFLAGLWLEAFPPPPRLTPTQVANLRRDRNLAALILLPTIAGGCLAAYLWGVLMQP